MRKIQTVKYEYKLIQNELWGNARDGFDVNEWFTLDTKETSERLSERWLLRWTRDHFEGLLFAWNEGKSKPMVRAGLEISHNSYMNPLLWDIEYRGHIVGTIEGHDLEDERAYRQSLVQAVTFLEE